jgi:hypothetical protein
MWIARLFGGRSGHDDDEQPTASPPSPPETQSAVTAQKIAVKRRAHDGQRKGFDPYNSGAFQRHVWERVNRD